MDRVPDASCIAAAFHKRADAYDQHVLVQKRVTANLAALVDKRLCLEPNKILDVGTGTGALLERMHILYPAASLTGVDVAYNMCLFAQQKLGAGCHIINGDAESLPFRSGSFDLVVSSSALQWVSNLSDTLHELHRVVRPGGTISLAFFCDGTLTELQGCFRNASRRLSDESSQTSSRLHGFWTVDEVTSIVKDMDLEEAVIALETEIDWYEDLHSLLRSIKSIGAGTVTGGTGRGLGWRGILHESSRLYQEQYGCNGRIPATYKVLYLSARTRS